MGTGSRRERRLENEAQEALRKNQEQMRLLQKIGGLGFFEWNIREGTYTCSGEFQYLYAIEEGSFPCTCEGWQALVYPEDLPEAVRQMHRAFETGTFLAEWRVRLPDGRVRWLEGRGQLFRDEKGEPERLVGVNIDITSRKDLEHELNQSSIFLELVMEGVSSAIFVLDEWGRFTRLNMAAIRLCGYPCEEILGQPFRMLVDESAAAQLESSLRLVISHGISLEEHECSIVRKDGSLRTLLLNVVPLLDRGRINGMIGSALDDTERRHFETRLQASEEKYRELVQGANSIIIRMDRSGVLTFANQYALKFFGYAEEELVGRPLIDTILPTTDSRGRNMSAMAEAILRNPPAHEQNENENVKRNGERVWISWTNRIIYEKGDFAGILSIGQDVTQRKRVEEALRRNEEWLSMAQAGAGIGIWSWDMQNRKPAFSEQCLGLLGITGEPDSPESLLALLHPEDRDRIRQSMENALRSSCHFKDEFRVTWPDGSVHWIMGRGKVYCDQEGNRRRVTGIVFDISDRKDAEEALERTMEELARSNRELEQFAYVASHDLQEPLRMITGYLQLLERRYKGVLDDKATQYIEFAVDGAARMQKLIEGLLTWSRITTRKEELRTVDTEAVFAGAVANLRAAIAESGADVTREALPSVRGSETQLLQLFQNLLSNALKYRKPGVTPRIHVSARREGMHWFFSISDNGIGIEPRNFHRIFQIFQRLHTREEYPGTGIGLASCKKIVEQHHGRIWVESAPGKGSTFSFTIPIEKG
ncbi:PAS domain S-box protein [Geobacter sp. DSM 9736]|uniref:PAS domain-containing sensor histidine kinase n=1 Tax=Geobacter sp. DSM 9736 TaxID=1277350 RepID=UPI000B50B485|nr:PAS domain S-box protein [Geobacter sp. DSM 9736]SNB44741.1 PAS domain S-box-containing protein [Geobacter sp. DSM 9736]